MNPPPNPRQPLWLPRGSVRAIIALSVITVWALLETGAIGPGAAGESVRTMALAVAAAYGFFRSRSSTETPNDHHPHHSPPPTSRTLHNLPQGARTIWQPAHRSNYYTPEDQPYAGAPRRQIAICYHTPRRTLGRQRSHPPMVPATRSQRLHRLLRRLRRRPLPNGARPPLRLGPGHPHPQPTQHPLPPPHLVARRTHLLQHLHALHRNRRLRPRHRPHLHPRLPPIPNRRRLVRPPVPQTQHPPGPSTPPRPQRTLHHQKRPRPQLPLATPPRSNRRPPHPPNHRPTPPNPGTPTHHPPNHTHGPPQ